MFDRGENMVFTNEQGNIIYDNLYKWLSIHTPGEHRCISVLKQYQKDVWNPIIENIRELQNKSILDKEEKDFLELALYNGPIFRIQNYNSKLKGYIFENDYYQSWSKSIEGIDKVSNFSGDVLIIVGTALNGIDVFGVLTFLFKYKKVTEVQLFRKPQGLLRYEEEEEIVYPINSNSINEIIAINKDDIYDWQNKKIIMPKEKWFRKTMR